jgi:hypothetical protein
MAVQLDRARVLLIPHLAQASLVEDHVARDHRDRHGADAVADAVEEARGGLAVIDRFPLDFGPVVLVQNIVDQKRAAQRMET